MEYEINQEKLDLFRSVRPAAGDEQRKTAAANMCKPFVTILEGGGQFNLSDGSEN